MVRKGLVIGTFLPPTRGHQQLIEFANRYMDAVNPKELHNLEVLVSSRSIEPMHGFDRVLAFRKQFDLWIKFSLFEDDNAPQNPKDENDTEFWDYWVRTIRENTDNKPGDILFASEAYGAKLAEVLECEFVPFNIERSTVNISATKIRQDPKKYFNMIMPEAQKMLRKTITVFGAESTGKTTMAKLLANELEGHFVPEWARSYLENMDDHTVTDEKMQAITFGQYASQQAVKKLEDKRFIIQDTDLLSTIGYYRIYNGIETPEAKALFNRSNLYIVMNSDIPFTPDKLRYGGDVRESTDQFWIDLLEEFQCNYWVMNAVDPKMQAIEAVEKCEEFFLQKNKVFGFKRD